MKTKKRVRGKWSNRYYVLFYRLAVKGYNDKKIAASCGVPIDTFNTWKKKKPTVKWLLKEARKPGGESSVDNVLEFIYNRLPPEHKKLYDEIMSVSGKKEKNGYERVRKLLENHGDETKKMLFLYAIVNSNFNKSEACRKICISTDVLARWMRDKNFVKMLDNVQEGLHDFYEGALVQAVGDGDTQAIIFANRTKNKARGYGDKLEVDHTHKGRIDHSHTFQLDIEKLSLKAQREVFDQIEAYEKKQERIEEMNLGKGQQLQIPHKNGKSNE